MKPQYEIGDKVYKAGTDYTDARVSCPDCLGTLKWTVVFADGEAVQVDCQTCKRGYMPPCGYIVYKQWQPSVDLLTIGQIHGWSPDEGFSYMCDETGIGSGTVHRESDLFSDKTCAETAAQIKHVEQMKRIAQNNFSKKLGGSKAIGEMLSTFGYSRREAVIKAREFAMWAGLSGLIKKK